MSTCEQAVVSLAAVVAQLDLAMRESKDPAQALGDAIGRISAGLGSQGAVPDLQREVSRCLEALQFYDRLTQHLSHLLTFMLEMTVTMDGELRGEDSDSVWSDLRTRLRGRLISDQQRELLDLLLPTAPGSMAAHRMTYEQHAAPGSVELF